MRRCRSSHTARALHLSCDSAAANVQANAEVQNPIFQSLDIETMTDVTSTVMKGGMAYGQQHAQPLGERAPRRALQKESPSLILLAFSWQSKSAKVPFKERLKKRGARGLARLHRPKKASRFSPKALTKMGGSAAQAHKNPHRVEAAKKLHPSPERRRGARRACARIQKEREITEALSNGVFP